MRPITLVTVILATCGAALSLSQTALLQDERLFLEPPDAALAVAPPAQARHVQRVGVNFEFLDSLRPGDGVTLNLPGGDVDAIVIDVVEQLGGPSIIGRILDLEGVEDGSFGIAVVNDAAAGWFTIPGRSDVLRVRYGGPGGLHYLYDVDGSVFPPCAGPFAAPANDQGDFVPADPNDARAAAERHMFDFESGVFTRLPGGHQNALVGGDGDGDGGPSPLGGCAPPPFRYFDIAVFYTDDARVAAGGTNAIQAECAAAVVKTWETYFNSLLTDIRPRLVHRSEVNYNETGSIDLDLNFLLNGSAGLGVCHTRRDNAGADFAVLLTNSGGGCGLAPCHVGASQAFCIVIWDCAVDNMSFAHEIGHIIGCDHDEDEGEGTGCYANWGLGNYFWVPAEELWRHTVMSYSNNDSTRIPFYSHPQVQYMGVSTGDSGHDNVSVIFNRKGTCENFRLTRMDVWVDFNWHGAQDGSFIFPYDTVIEGVNRILNEPGMSETPVLRIKAGSRNEAITITKPMMIDSCGGTATIGQ